MRIVMANPRGFCAGVDRAIAIVNRALDLFEHPIYVRHEVVHNKFVVNDLKSRGAIFVKELDQVPDNQIVIFSAHGVPKSVQNEAERRSLQVFDATCPLVTKVHMEVLKIGQQGLDCVLIGHAGHPEVQGTMGQFDDAYGGQIYLVENEKDVAQLSPRRTDALAYVTQTTLSVDDTRKIVMALKARFPGIRGPRKDDICYATQNRQDAVKLLAAETDVVLVVGSTNSSNSNRLRELAERCGAPAYLIDSPSDLQEAWFDRARAVGVTAGASAPEALVQDVVKWLQGFSGALPEELAGIEEDVIFSLPKSIRVAAQATQPQSQIPSLTLE